MSLTRFPAPRGCYRGAGDSGKRKQKSQILEGFCCLYNVEHRYKDRTEVFLPGCFTGSLFGVMFKIDHRLQEKKLGDQDDGSLELIDGDIGLAFRLKLTPEI